jgi:programmed cell death 8 (apoptosis-inducing factor)
VHFLQKKNNVIERNPQQSSSIPGEVPYLLIGAGTAAFSAFRSIKANDPTAKVILIFNAF